MSQTTVVKSATGFITQAFTAKTNLENDFSKAHYHLVHNITHPTCQGTVWGSINGSEPAPHETRSLNQQSADFNQKSKEYKPKSIRFQNQQNLSQYGDQYSNKSQYQLKETEMSLQQNKGTACAENQRRTAACKFSSFCSDQPQWF